MSGNGLGVYLMPSGRSAKNERTTEDGEVLMRYLDGECEQVTVSPAFLTRACVRHHGLTPMQLRRIQNVKSDDLRLPIRTRRLVDWRMAEDAA